MAFLFVSVYHPYTFINIKNKYHLLNNMFSLRKTTWGLRNIFKFNKFTFAASEAPKLESGKDTALQPWIISQNNLTKQASELILADNSKIENYVLNVIKGYFRTTYKDGLTLDSNLAEHGLDSLDAVELCMVLEDELGYIIEAEVMPKFYKPKHFVNYIKHMEAYKREFHFLPQIRAQKDEENLNEWIPGGETLKQKLYSFIKPKDGSATKEATKAAKKDDAKH
jgi:acyl carrier protein